MVREHVSVSFEIKTGHVSIKQRGWSKRNIPISIWSNWRRRNRFSLLSYRPLQSKVEWKKGEWIEEGGRFVLFRVESTRRRWAETFTADCAPAEGHNACIKPLAGRLIEMRGSFDRGAAIARIQSVIEKTRGSVGPFLFSFRLGPKPGPTEEKSFVSYHLHFARSY